MAWADRLAPRDRRVAPRVALAFYAAATVISLFNQPGGSGWVPVASNAFPVAMLLTSAVLAWRPDRSPRASCVGLALGGLLGGWFLDLVTRDASFGAQVVLIYPVLFAASQLHRAAAWMLAVAAIVADAGVVFALVSADRADSDIGYFTVTVVTVTALLVHAGDRQQALVEELRGLAAVDPLTGLANRRSLDEVARTVVGRQGTGTALILIDLDHFKTINDRYGHPVGDTVLQHVATAVSALCRVGDVAARIGGDELALLLPGCTPQAAARRAQEIVEAVRRTPTLLPDGVQVTASVSVGYGHTSMGDDADLAGLYTLADGALYLAKGRGRDQSAGPDQV